MSEFDRHTKMTLAQALAHGAQTGATVDGDAVDTVNYNSCEYAIHVSTAFAGGGYNAVPQQSPDDGSGSPTGVWTDVPAEEVLGSALIEIGDSDKVLRIGSIGKERHQRLRLAETGTVSAGAAGAVAVLEHARYEPTPEQDT